MLWRSVFFLLSLAVSWSWAANILCLMGVASPSHFIWNRAVMSALAEKGHNLTIISTDVEKNSKNMNYIHLENVYPTYYNGSEQLDFNDLANDGPLAEIKSFYNYGTLGCKGTVTSKGFKELQNYPKDFKFDVVVHDYTIGPCLLGFLKQFNYPPLVGITAFNNPPYSIHMVGGHRPYAYIPLYSLNYDMKMNFLQRSYNVFLHFADELYRRYIAYPEIRKFMIEGYGKDVPDLQHLESLHKILLVNSHPAVDFPEPFGPNIIPVGGLQMSNPKPLPSDILDFIERGKKGSVLFSIGTNFRSDSINDEKLQMFLDAFQQLPEYNFLWKFESDKLNGKIPNNVMLKAWLPQGDILDHPNIKAFITHSGLLSTHETVWRGVPVVSMPLFADQHRNSFKVIQMGGGEKLDFINLRTKDIVKILKRVLENKRYGETMKLRSQQFRDQPEHPLERAVWWIEWVMRVPNVDHIRPPVLEMGFIRANCLDIVFVAIFVFIVLVVICLKIVCRFSSKPSKNKAKEE